MKHKKTSHDSPIQIDTRSKSTSSSSDLLSDRVKRARRDRLFLTRCIALLLFVVAAANVGPAWLQIYSDGGEAETIPKWVYIQLFVAFLHAIYGVFLWQIPDWSALRAVAILLLVSSAVFGFVAAALVVRGGESEVAQFLDLPFALIQRATIWCVATLLFEVVGSYIAGIEALNWQKMERLLQQVSGNDRAAMSTGSS